MSDNPHYYKGYSVLPQTDPITKEVNGWYVKELSRQFLSEDEAHNAIDLRINELGNELKDHL